MKRYVFIALGVALVMMVIVIAAPYFMTYGARPPRTPLQTSLYQGVEYVREPRDTPRPMMVHVVTVNLTAPGVRVLVTPGQAVGGREMIARTTSQFLEEFDLQVAVNGGFFGPFYSRGLWDYYPHGGNPVNVRGLAISNGETYSTSRPGTVVLCISPDNRAQMAYEICPSETQQAIAGTPALLRQGHPANLTGRAFYSDLHPRTAVAIDETGETLWLLVVDGRQSGYSDGITLNELAQIGLDYGAYDALNLDGGGSTTLVTEGAMGAYVRNAPIHSRIPMRQRPVANHLGIYARPN